jgi:dipeptidyl aminopeptidase/acylaminoacyl peptidase
MLPSVLSRFTVFQRVLFAVLVVAAIAALPTARPQADVSTVVKPNYDLASQWTGEKVGKLLFDTSVAPRWFEGGDRFWYAFQTREGRKFYLVEPAKKSKAPLFDHAKMAATLTQMIGQPYETAHLPFSTVRFVKKDAAFQFDIPVLRTLTINAKPIEKPKTTTAPIDDAVDQESGADTELLSDDQQQQQGQRGQRGDQVQGQRGQGTAAAPTPPRNRTLRFEYDMATGKVDLLEDDYRAPQRPRWPSFSPDRKTVLFARNHNLYMMDAESYALAEKKADDPKIVEVQLTKDGEEHYSFAGSGARGGGDQQQQQQEDQGGAGEATGQAADKNARVPAIQVTWSKDSSRFSVVRRDQRKVADLWVIDSLAQPRPKLETYRYAMPGEPNIAIPELMVFNVATKALVKIKTDKFKDQSISVATAPTRGGAGGGRGGGGGAADPDQTPPPPMWMSESPTRLYITRQSRDLKKVDVCLANPDTGEVKVLVEERLNTYIETKPLRLVNNQQDLIFWSERTGWGHFYLYDANTGALKNAITSGEFVVTGLDAIDEKPAAAAGAKQPAGVKAGAAATAPAMYFTATGREPSEDPYYPHFYRVNLDGTGLKLLNPGDANHATSLGESNKFFVDNASRVDEAPVSTLYDTNGTVLFKLETTDLTTLKEAGFKFPAPFRVKADDGITDLYGVMYKPFDFDPAKKYPVILYVYPGPQTESVTKTFNPRAYSMTLAQYGFIVIEVGNRGGSPNRSKWYHNYGYGNLRDYGLVDKKVAVEQLARKNPFIDVNRVGMWGHSGGGFMTAAALLVYPDFFKVGWSESGNHENNIYNNTWSERHHGITEVTDKDGKVTFEYSIEKNSELAKNLKGHLALITGDIDNNVHPANTYRLADALVKANKRFEFYLVPGQRHGYAASGAWVAAMRADFFCRWLLGQSNEGADIVELNREREQGGERGATTTTTGGRGGRGGQ